MSTTVMVLHLAGLRRGSRS